MSRKTLKRIRRALLIGAIIVDVVYITLAVTGHLDEDDN